MFRQTVLTAAMLLVLASPRAFALGMGDIDMRSALNQPMDAVIELTSANTTNLDDIRVSLASLEAHKRTGMTKAAILADFKFTVEKNAAGKAVIRISSDTLVREPYLEFLLELDWPRGRLLRQYTVLVDPPVTMPAAAPTPAAPVRRAVTAPATASAPPPSVSAPVQPTADSYGPVRRNETLWSIASQLRPDDGVSIEQVMLALQRANPQAFEGGNINRLQQGVTLDVPSREDMVSISRREASAESSRQYAEWQESRGQPSSVAATQPDAAADETDTAASETGSTAADDATRMATETRLQLTAPEADAVTGAAVPGDPLSGEPSDDPETLQQQLTLAAEEVAAERAQSQELQSQVSELEEQITTMQRLLELKDNELARLQQTLGEEPLPDSVVDEAASAALPEAVAEVEVDTAVEPVAAAMGETEPVEEPQPAVTPTPVAASDSLLETALSVVQGLPDRIMGWIGNLKDNPLYAGIAGAVLLLLGGLMWFMRRSRDEDEGLDDGLTMRHQLAGVADAADESPAVAQTEVTRDEPFIPEEEHTTEAADHLDSDPITEADVYLAYGRIQQAEDVLLAALQSQPENAAARMKLLEVYHSGGNAAAFDQAAAAYHEMFGSDDSQWDKIATMGMALSPHNTLYGGGEPAPVEEVASELDLSAMTEQPAEAEARVEEQVEEPVASNTIEFTLDTAGSDEEDVTEGLLENVDEMTTKLDLARAYIDMDDADSARSILGEVIEEGTDEQKEEAENIISKLA